LTWCGKKLFSVWKYIISVQLLGAMQELIDNALTVSPRHVENWKQVSETQICMLNRKSVYLYVCDFVTKYMLIYALILISYMDAFSCQSTLWSCSFFVQHGMVGLM
jgi:hypothetical protein